MDEVQKNVEVIKSKIAPYNPTIVAVTKYFDENQIVKYYELGFRDFGENRVKDAVEKIAKLPKEIVENSRFHLIGHLQSNKVKLVVGKFYLIHSVDSLKLAQCISEEAIRQGIKQKILLQVNNANEEQKSGFSPKELEHQFEEIQKLAGIEIEYVGVENMQFVLKEQIADLKSKFDYIIIDCPPALGLLTVNCLVAADTVLVPIQCEFFALDGLSQLIYTIDLMKDNLNPDLYIEGICFTMFDARTNLSLQVVENVKDNLKQNIYKTIIPRNVRLAEAPSHGLPITIYDSRSAGAVAYRELALEVVENA